MPATTGRSPGFKLLLTILVGLALSIPLFTVWLLVYDRQTQSDTAQASIAEGWGGPQVMSGPMLVIPYRTLVSETVLENNREVTRTREVERTLTLAPEQSELTTEMRPERRHPLLRLSYSAGCHERKAEIGWEPVENARQSITVNHGVQRAFARNMLEKRPLLLVRLHQMKARLRRHDRHRNRRQPSPAPEVEYLPTRLEDPRRLHPLRDVVVEVLPRLRPDQIHLRRPREEKLLVKGEPGIHAPAKDLRMVERGQSSPRSTFSSPGRAG